MCSRIRCRNCGLTSWSGCGAHVDEVMRDVPSSQRCTCERGGSRRDRSARRPLLARILGRA